MVYTEIAEFNPLLHLSKFFSFGFASSHIIKWCQLCSLYLSFIENSLKFHSFHFSIFIKCCAFIDLRINFIKSKVRNLISIGSVSLVAGHFVSRKFSFVGIFEFALRALMLCQRLLHPAVDAVNVLHVVDDLVHVHRVEAAKTAPVKTVSYVKRFLKNKTKKLTQ